jgi:hypothetical protein
MKDPTDSLEDEQEFLNVVYIRCCGVGQVLRCTQETALLQYSDRTDVGDGDIGIERA